MAVQIPRTGTEWVANELTVRRGSTADITFVGTFYTNDPAVIPDLDDFTETVLVEPGDPLAEGDLTDIATLVGPRNGHVTLAPGDYQTWVRVSTVTEDIIRRPDTITIL